MTLARKEKSSIFRLGFLGQRSGSKCIKLYRTRHPIVENVHIGFYKLAICSKANKCSACMHIQCPKPAGFGRKAAWIRLLMPLCPYCSVHNGSSQASKHKTQQKKASFTRQGSAFIKYLHARTGRHLECIVTLWKAPALST